MNWKLFVRNQYFTAFWITLVVALGLLIWGFFAPPYGEISGSVLEASGIVFLWPALAFANKALEEGKTARITKGNMKIDIGTDKDQPNEEMNEEIDNG